MPWVAGRGLRLRITYLNAMGETRGDRRGWTLRIPGRPDVAVPGRVVPKALRRPSPVYGYGSRVGVLIQVRNTGSTVLRGLNIQLRQEAFQASGRPGPLAAPLPRSLSVPELKPGESKVLLGLVRLMQVAPPNAPLINFEQTHVTVDRGAMTKVLLLPTCW